MYEVFGTVRSRAFRVIWALEELNQDYKLHIEAPHSDVVLALNPTGKTPVLRDGDDIITDSTVIMNHLADKHGDLTAPAGTIERAHQDALTLKLIDEVDAVLWINTRNNFAFPEDKRVAGLEPTMHWDFEQSIKNVMQLKKGPYLLGDGLTVPDILLTTCGNWASDVGFPVDNPEFQNYRLEISKRAAYQKVFAML